jgi:hypothetical protein
LCVGVNVLMTCTWHLAGHVGRYGISGSGKLIRDIYIHTDLYIG